MVVHPRAEEADLDLGVDVLLGQRGEPLIDLVLAQPVLELELAVEADLVGDLGEQLVDRGGADRLQHLPAVGVGR